MTDLPPAGSVPVAKAPGRGLKIALAVSLALNLAVLGAVAGMVLRGHESGRPGAIAVRDLSFGPFTDALTRDQRRAMLRGFIENGPGLRAMRDQIKGDLDAVLTALRATPFDPSQFRAAVDGQSRRMAARTEAGREALVTLVLQMTDAERAVFVERLEKSLSRRGEKSDRDAGRGGGN